MIVIDVGAHDGTAFSLPFAQDKHNIVYAIEPIPDLAQKLRSYNKRNLLVFCTAFSDTVGENVFHVNSDKQTSSLLDANCTQAWAKYAGQLVTEKDITVSVTRLDRFLAEQSIDEVDLLKIDTQGNDFSVILGAGEAISRIRRIILEVQLTPLYHGAASKERIIAYLEEKGFRCVSATAQTDNLEENLEFVRVNRYPSLSSATSSFKAHLPFVGEIQFPQHDHVGKLLEEGTFEGPEQAFLWLYLREGNSFLDCGAHAGLFSCIAAKAIESTGRIVAIEPNPICYDVLKNNVYAYAGETAQALNCGLSDSNGQAQLFLGKDGMSAFSTLTSSFSSQQIGSKSIDIELQTLDGIIQSIGADEVFTLAKLDVEGWEIPVLNGAANTILNRKLPVWVVEFTEENAQAAGSSTQALRAHLKALGYSMCHFNATTLQLEPEPPYSIYAYKNLYAVHDMDAVNARLAQADPTRVTMAKTIIHQWDVAVEAARLRFTLNQQKEQLLERLQDQQRENNTLQQRFNEETQRLESHHKQAMQRLHGQLEAANQLTVKTQAELAASQRSLHDLDISRANVINQLYHSKTKIESHNAHLTQRIAARGATIEHLKQRIQAKDDHIEQVRQDMLHEIDHLGAEVARLQVGREALKEVLKSLLRRLGLFASVKRLLRGPDPSPAVQSESNSQSQQSHNSVVDHNRVTLPRASQSSTLAPAQLSPTDAVLKDTPEQAIQSDLANATVIARGFGVDIVRNATALEQVVQTMSSVTSALCLDPHRRMIPLIQHLVKEGESVKEGEIVCTSRAIASELASYGIPLQDSFARWLVLREEPLSTDFDLVCVDLETLGATNHGLLQGRLAPDTALLVANATNSSDGSDDSSALSARAALGEPTATLGHLLYYASPPSPWTDPLYQVRPSTDQEQLWPWNYRLSPFPRVMPSGRPWPKISIVTVSFNHGQFIEETIRSVICQGYPNLEYIVIDGGSTDGTIPILERYASALSYWISEPDGGQSNALNKGFQRATGDILAWLNSDDRYLPHTLARVAIAFDTYQTDMVAGGCQLAQDYRTNPFRTHRSKFPIGEVVPLPLSDLLDIENCWHQGHFFYQPEVFWTRDIWQRAGGQLDESLFYSMDYDLWVRMAQQGARLLHSPDALALYRVHSDQKTFGDDVPYMPELKGVSDRYRDIFALEHPDQTGLDQSGLEQPDLKQPDLEQLDSEQSLSNGRNA